jgi:hypothetical protein
LKKLLLGAMIISLMPDGSMFAMQHDRYRHQPSTHFRDQLFAMIGVGYVAMVAYVIWLQQSSDTIPLPLFLQNLDHIEVVHYRVPQQIGPTCGWYALANALTMQQLIQSGAEITMRSIGKTFDKVWRQEIMANRTKLLKLTSHDYMTGLSCTEIGTLVSAVGLANCFTIDLLAGSTWFYSKDHSLEHDYLWKSQDVGCYFMINMEAFLADMVFKKNYPYVTFMFAHDCDATNNGGHVVTVTMITRKGKKPLVIYLDSNNAPLDRMNYDYGTPFFVSKFLKRLDSACRVPAKA